MRELLIRAWRGNAVHLAAAGVLMVVAAAELAMLKGIGTMTLVCQLFTVAYMLAVSALPLVPVQASVVIIVAALAESAMPGFLLGDGYVHAQWGFVYALIVLAVERSVWIPSIIVVALCVFLIARGGNLDESMAGPGLFNLPARVAVPFMLVALAVCVIIYLLHKAVSERLREREAAEARQRLLEQENAQYLERLNVLHQLHDSVAGTLTYALMLCRRGRSEGDVDQYRYVENAIGEALDHMRREVIEPTRRLIDERDGMNVPTVVGGPSARLRPAGEPGMIDLQLGKTATRLRRLGFQCETLLRGDVAGLSPELAALVARTLEEIGNNVLKHGKIGYCAITVTVGNDGSVRIWSSNMTDAEQPQVAGSTGEAHSSVVSSSADSEDCSDNAARSSESCEGLALIRRSVRPFGGTLTTSCEGGEWTVVVTIPSGVRVGDVRQANDTLDCRNSMKGC